MFEKLSHGNYLVLLYFGKWPVAMALLLLQNVWGTLRPFFCLKNLVMGTTWYQLTLEMAGRDGFFVASEHLGRS